MITKKLAKMGNSRGVLIPADVLDLIGWDDQTEIEIVGLGGGRLELIGNQPPPPVPPPRPNLFTRKEQ